jgi:hypothetical protein
MVFHNPDVFPLELQIYPALYDNRVDPNQGQFSVCVLSLEIQASGHLNGVESSIAGPFELNSSLQF